MGAGGGGRGGAARSASRIRVTAPPMPPSQTFPGSSSRRVCAVLRPESSHPPADAPPNPPPALQADLTALHLNVSATGAGSISGSVSFANATVATFSGAAGSQIDVPIPNPQLWHPTSPHLYQFSVVFTDAASGATDAVGSYFGMRTVTLANFTSPPTPATGPRIGMDNSGGACRPQAARARPGPTAAPLLRARALPSPPLAGDMPNQPTVLPKSDYNLCWAKCNATEGCMVRGGGGDASAGPST